MSTISIGALWNGRIISESVITGVSIDKLDIFLSNYMPFSIETAHFVAGLVGFKIIRPPIENVLITKHEENFYYFVPTLINLSICLKIE